MRVDSAKRRKDAGSLAYVLGLLLHYPQQVVVMQQERDATVERVRDEAQQQIEHAF